MTNTKALYQNVCKSINKLTNKEIGGEEREGGRESIIHTNENQLQIYFILDKIRVLCPYYILVLYTHI